MKDYDCEINYHPGKANVVADALSRNTSHMPSFDVTSKELANELEAFEVEIISKDTKAFLAHLTVKSSLRQKMIDAQQGDIKLMELRKSVGKGDNSILELLNTS